MTEEQLQIEWNVRYEERLGIMCGNAEPTKKQIHIAKCEADEAIARLKNEPSASGMAQ